MIFKQILMWVILGFFLLGLADRALGFKFGIGKEFLKGTDLMGLFALQCVGMICFAPVLAKLLIPVVSPIYSALGADPAMFAPNFIAVDAGGYAISTQMARDPMIGRWAGVCVGSLLGATLSFNIPVLFGLVGKENYRSFSIGALSAMISAPNGCIVGGLCCGIEISAILTNLIPVIIVAVIIAVGLLFVPDVVIRVFIIFAKFLMVVISIGLALALLKSMTGVELVEGVLPLGDGLLVAGSICFTCTGAICMVYALIKLAGKPIGKLGELIGLNDVALINTFIGFSTVAPGGACYNDMNPRGKVVFSTVACTAANILGAHMGFVAAQDPEMLPVLFVSKLSSAVVALPLAFFFAKRLLQHSTAALDT